MREKVLYRDVMETRGGEERRGALTFTAGLDLQGRFVRANFREFRNLAVGGRSFANEALLQAMISELAACYSPKKLQMILMDGTGEALCAFQGLPHLISGEVVTELPLALGALDWVICEMARRFDLLNAKIASGASIRNVDDYNDVCMEDEKLAKILIVVGELRELMRSNDRGTQQRLQALMKMGHAVGIHVAVATSDLSPDVLTGAIRTRCGAKIAFHLSDERASRAIIEEDSATMLVEQDDLLLLFNGWAAAERLQGVTISPAESEECVTLARERYASDSVYAGIRFSAVDDD